MLYVAYHNINYKYSHAFVDLLALSLILQPGLCQINGEDASNSNYASNATIDELGGEAEGDDRKEWQKIKTNYLV